MRRDGEERDVLYSVAEVTYRGVPHRVSSGIDVTDFKRAEQARRESEERLSLALDAAQMGIFDWDLLNNQIVWSRWHEEIWGYAPREFDGSYRGFLDRVHPDDGPELQAEATRCMETADRFVREFRVVWPDHSVHWVVGIGEFEFDADGKACRMRGVCRDITARKNAEAQLVEKDELLSESQRLGRIGGWTWTRESAKIRWTDEMYRIYGVSPEQFDPTTDDRARSRVHPSDRELFQEWVRQTIAGENPDELEFRLALPDRVKHVRARGEIVIDPEGKPLRAIGTLQDVTERRKSVDRIAQLNRVYAVLSATNKMIVRERDPSVLLDSACRISVDKGEFSLAWVGLADADNGRLRMVAHAGADESTAELLHHLLEAPRPGCEFTAQAMSSGKSAVCDDIAQQPESVVWREAALSRGYRAMVSLPLCSQGECFGAINLYAESAGFFDDSEMVLLEELAADIGFALEVHERDQERQRAVEALRASESSLAAAQQRAQLGSWELDLADATSVWSAEMSRLHSRDPALPAPTFAEFVEVVHPDDREALLENHAKLLDAQGPLQHEYRTNPVLGPVRYMSSVLHVMRNESGPYRVVGNSMDVTEQKSAEAEIYALNESLEKRVWERTAQLEAANKELETFSYSVSHDLRAPLRAISGFSHIVARRHRDDLNEEGRRYLDNIVEASDRMERLIEDLLGFSRLGRSSIQLHPMSLANVVAEVLADLAPSARDVGAMIHVGPSLPTVAGDRTLLNQVFLNLLGNALAYRRVGVEPVIWVTAESQAGRALVTVKDNGIGIPPEHHEKIFNVFQRLHSEDDIPGTGIGLATVKKSMALLGGNIRVRSSPGEGSSFTIDLALASRNGVVALESRPVIANSGGLL